MSCRAPQAAAGTRWRRRSQHSRPGPRGRRRPRRPHRGWQRPEQVHHRRIARGGYGPQGFDSHGKNMRDRLRDRAPPRPRRREPGSTYIPTPSPYGARAAWFAAQADHNHQRTVECFQQSAFRSAPGTRGPTSVRVEARSAAQERSAGRRRRRPRLGRLRPPAARVG